jgi:hypothetical protein
MPAACGPCIRVLSQDQNDTHWAQALPSALGIWRQELADVLDAPLPEKGESSGTENREPFMIREKETEKGRLDMRIIILAGALIGTLLVVQFRTTVADTCSDSCDRAYASCSKTCKTTDCFTKCINEKESCLALCK